MEAMILEVTVVNLMVKHFRDKHQNTGSRSKPGQDGRLTLVAHGGLCREKEAGRMQC